MNDIAKVFHKIKKWLGNHDDDLSVISEKIRDIAEREAVELVKSGSEKAWDAVKGIQVAGIVITRELYDSVVRAIVDQIIELGGDK